MYGFAEGDLLCSLRCDVRVNYVISCLPLTVTGGAPQCRASHGTFHLSCLTLLGFHKKKVTESWGNSVISCIWPGYKKFRGKVNSLHKQLSYLLQLYDILSYCML